MGSSSKDGGCQWEVARGDLNSKCYFVVVLSTERYCRNQHDRSVKLDALLCKLVLQYSKEKMQLGGHLSVWTCGPQL